MTDLLGTVDQYIGRTVDYAFLQGDTLYGNVLLDQSLIRDNDGGRVATGIKKVIQRFVLRLNTKKGSMPYWPDEGTDFMLLAEVGALRTVLDVIQAFSQAERDISRLEARYRDNSKPADEQYESAELVNAIVTPGSVAITVRLVTQAGSSSSFIFPIALAVVR